MQGEPGLAMVRRRRWWRRARVALVLVVLLAVVGLVGLAAIGYGGRQPAAPARSTLPGATATVTRETLTLTERVSGTLSYGAQRTLSARPPMAVPTSSAAGASSGGASSAAGASSGGASSGTGTGGGAGPGDASSGGAGTGGPTDSAAAGPGTITWLPAPARVISRGQPAYRVNDHPVPLLYGPLPMYRVLQAGLGGADVRQFERNLAALGYRGFTVDGSYTTATANVVKRWQAALGAPVTGMVNVDQVAYTTGPLRVAQVQAGLGAEAAGPVFAYTGISRVVSIDLDVGDQSLVRPGVAATVTLPDGRTVPGRVSTVGTVVTASAGGDGGGQGDGGGGGGGPGGSAPTIPVTVKLDKQSALGTLQSAPVDVTLVAGRVANVLTVPVQALVALAEGGYGLQLVSGSTARYVPVTTGTFADGKVQVSGPGISAGLVVGMPS